jgi:hypothetical protein
MFALASTSSAETPTRRTGRLMLPSAIVVAFAAASVGMVAGPAAAAPGDTSSDTTVANVEVSTAIALTGLTPAFTLNGVPGGTVSEVGVVTFNVATNNFAGYSVTVHSNTATMLANTSANTDSIPIAALTVRESGTVPYAPMSSTSAGTVHLQNERSASGGDDLSNDYLVGIPFVNEDTYTATLDYVATTL